MTRKIILLACALCISACSSINIRNNNKGIGIDDRPSIQYPSLSLDSTKTIHNPISSVVTPPWSSSIGVSIPISSSSAPSEDEDYFYSDKYGPFEVGADDFEATFTYQLNTVSDQTILERIRLFNASNSVVASSTKTRIDYITGTRNNVTFLIPIHNYLTNNGLTLKFEILNYRSREIIKEYSAKFYPPSNQTISWEILKRGSYQSRSLGFYGDGKEMKEIIESFDFHGFGDFLNINNYYKLDITNNVFNYTNGSSLIYGSLNLRFNDSENLFPYYTHNDKDEIIVPLKLKKANGIARFDYSKVFYLNKKTLQISDKYRSPFVLTNSFYLPINGRNSFNEKRLYLDVTGLGWDKLNTAISVKYDTSKALVGVCTDGEYCVEGGNI